MTYPPPPPAPPLPPQFQPPFQPQGEPPLWAPYYGASIGVAFKRFWQKYATFSGRASRSEFWWWELIAAIFGVAVEVIFIAVLVPTTILSSSSDGDPLAYSPAYWIVTLLVWLVSLAILIPSLSLTWRRLHDTGRSGGYYFLGLIPFVGGIILLVLLAGASNPEGARYDQPR